MDYKICNRCVMDNYSDNTIVFDEMGNCNYCNEVIIAKPKTYFPNKEGKKRLESTISMLKTEGKGKKYDCIMGLSGGLDSSYLAYLGYEYGLRILAVHIDDGFDSPIAIDNINKLSKACNIDVIMEKPDKEQFYDLTAAFIRAGVPNIAIPQDNLIIGYLYKHARENNTKYWLSGGNFPLESILQRGNTHDALDKVHIIDINKKFGRKPIDKLQIISSFERRISNRLLFKISEIKPLNFIDYDKSRAISELNKFCGYNYYDGKHYESILTRFVQVYYLPRKFNVDKRKSHLSSLIISGQITRDQALEELKKPLYNDDQIQKDINYILKCIDMSRDEFEKIMMQPQHKHEDYKVSNWGFINRLLRKVRGY